MVLTGTHTPFLGAGRRGCGLVVVARLPGVEAYRCGRAPRGVVFANRDRYPLDPLDSRLELEASVFPKLNQLQFHF
jgi:hypothetical protein